MVPRTDAILFSGGAQGAEAEFGAAAERLGIHPNTLRFRMKKLDIMSPRDMRAARQAGSS